MTRHAPLVRQRAAAGPRRGSTRAVPTTYSTEHGSLHVSHNIPEREHELVLAAFEKHAASGFGERCPRTTMMVSTTRTPGGTVILSTDLSTQSTLDIPARGSSRSAASFTDRLSTARPTTEHFAFYDWEYT